MDASLGERAKNSTNGEIAQPGKVILLIDDQTEILENMKEYLELDNFKVLVITGCNNLLNQVLVIQPDLIVCDLLMPEINGYEALQLLLHSPFTSQIPFIFSSSCSNRSGIAKAMAMGADDYLVKPFDPEDLLVAVKLLLKTGSKRCNII